MSETSKYRHLTTSYCTGNGLDIGSGGDPVVPSAIQVELPPAQYATYNDGHTPQCPVHYASPDAATRLPFKDATLDYVYASHLLEDYSNWWLVLAEWVRVLRGGGHLIILVPDFERWRVAVANGQPPNSAHQHEGRVGELSQYASPLGLRVVRDSLTDLTPADYSILFIATKL